MNLTDQSEWLSIQNDKGFVDTFLPVGGHVWRAMADQDHLLYFDEGNQAVPWIEVFGDDHLILYDASGRLFEIRYPDDEKRSLYVNYVIQDPGPPPPFVNPTYFNPYVEAAKQVTDATGRGIEFEYASHDPPVFSDAFPQLQAVNAVPSGEALAIYGYDGDGRLSDVTTASGDRTYVYGEAGHVGAPNQIYNLTSIIDENDAAFASYSYDAYGRVTDSEHAGGAGAVHLAYTSDASVSVTQASGEVVQYTFQDPTLAGSDIWRRPTSRMDGSGFTSSTVLNNSASCPASLANPADERVCQEIDRRQIVTQYQYGAANSHLFVTAKIEAAGTPQQRRVETDRYGQSVNYRVKERRVFNAGNALEAKTQWTYNARSQIALRCEIDVTPNVVDPNYFCNAVDPLPDGVRRWTYTYCEQAGSGCPVIGFLTQINGPRPANDAGMQAGQDDTTSYSYYTSTDESACGTFAGPCHRSGDPWRVINALGQFTESTTYDSEGRVVRLQDVNGTYTDFTYHPRGWLLTRTVRANANGSPSSNDATTTIVYDSVGNVIQVTQPDGAYLHYGYDDAHRLTDVNDNLNNRIHYTLDASGNRTKEQTYDPSNTLKRQLARSYDKMNRLYQTLNAANLPTQTYPTGTGYDENGNPVLSSDGLGYATQQTYDPLNRLVKTLQNYNGGDLATKNAETDYTYDTRDNLLTVRDPSGYLTTYSYDGLNNLTGLQSPDTGTSGPYASDLAGNRVSQTDARGKVSTFAYDALNRLTAISYPATPSLNVGYAYDQINAITGCTTSYPLGRPTTMTDASGTTIYCYDRRGNVTQKSQTQKGVTLTTSYSYTLADRLSQVTYPGGSLTSYPRDSTGRITKVKWAAAQNQLMTTVVSNVGYYPFGPANTLTFNNGRIETKTYDADYAIDQITSSAAGGLTLDFGVDVMGDVTAVSQTLNNPTTPDRTYSYDPLYRLTKVLTGSPPSLLEGYSYNKTGDRTSATIGNSTLIYTYAPNTHHLASAGSARGYDANGNTTSANGITFTYDDRNRLSQAGTATYTYDGKGERVAKKSATQNSLFVYDESGKLLGEYTSTGTPIQTYLWLDDTLVGIRQNSTTYYVETDHLGTPRKVIDPATNAAAWSWDFLGSAFGTNSPTATSFTLNLRFPGQYYDSETGLNYNHSRDYESATGRYVESDWIGLLGGISTYAYVSDDPLRYVDPAGEARVVECGGGCKLRIERDPHKGLHAHWECINGSNSGDSGCIKIDGSSCDGSGKPNRRICSCLQKAGFPCEPIPAPEPQPIQVPELKCDNKCKATMVFIGVVGFVLGCIGVLN